MIRKTHYFFLLNLRPWPFIIRICSFNLLISILFFLKSYSLSCFSFSLFNLIIASFFWWITYRSEFNLEGKNSLTLEKGIKLRIILFISSEIFFFFSFFWSYFHYFLSPRIELGLSWPPVNIESFDFIGVPLINTLVLIRSGLTVTVRHYFLIKGKYKNSNFWLFTTILLGIFFSFLQTIEYKNSFFSIRDGRFGTSFFMLTGFHGIHVIIGSIYLATTLIRSIFMSRATSNFLRFELSSWYWHFVDVVWIFLYCFLYYIID